MSTENNIKLYPWYQASASFLPWMPVFFLYFSATVNLNQAIELGAIYYLAVVVFEVPSGYISDRLGRRATLLLAATFATASYAVFLFADGFEWFAAGQILLAGAIAFQSGSDSSLLYDSLFALQRQSEYESHESRAHQYGMTSLAISVLLGGVLGSINLKYAYATALAAAIVTTILCWWFTEPQRTDGSVTLPFLTQLRSVLSAMNSPILKWVLCFYIAGYSLQHIPYDFYQPYITLLKSEGTAEFFSRFDAALISGIVIGLSMFGGALGAAASRRLSSRFGAVNILVTGVSMQTAIIAAMAIVLHPIVLLIIVFRNFSMSMTHAPMHGLIAPRVASAQRATYLSLQSLFGRLAFSGLLYAIASQASQTLNWPTLSWIFKTSAMLGLAVIILLLVFQPQKPASQQP